MYSRILVVFYVITGINMCMCVYVCVCVYSRTLVVFYVITRQNMDLLFDIESVSVIEKRRRIQDFSFYEEDFLFLLSDKNLGCFLLRLSLREHMASLPAWVSFPLQCYALAAFSYAFALGRERLNMRRPRVMLRVLLRFRASLLVHTF